MEGIDEQNDSRLHDDEVQSVFLGERTDGVVILDSDFERRDLGVVVIGRMDASGND